MVYVINKDGEPLMPTEKHGMVKHFLKNGLATVERRTPFTVKLTYDAKSYTQPVTLGVDAGSKTAGLSAATAKKELYAAEAELRNDIVRLLAQRSQYRRSRRNRKTRYRAARSDNRKKPEGWLAPSVQHKIDSHLRLVADIHKILPITQIIVEVASFDIQKIKNPGIEGERYQQGDQLGFWNVREYVLFRDGHKCQRCKGKSGDKILNVHHIESRQTGGDAPSNLITLCETCHKAYHKGLTKLDVKRGASCRDAAFMGIMRWAVYGKLKELYPDVKMTYGYITKNARIANGITKTHAADAFCITGNVDAKRSDTIYMQKFVRKCNRQLHKANPSKGGKRKANKAPRMVKGFRLFDKVLCQGRECFIFGRRARGSFDIRLLDGTKIHAGISYKRLALIERTKTLLTERRGCTSPCLKAGVSAA